MAAFALPPFDVFRLVNGGLLLAALGSCTTQAPRAPATTQAAEPAPPPQNALAAGVKAGPSVASLGVTAEAAARALRAFRISCPSLVKRVDLSQLAAPEDWAAACMAAERWPEAEAQQFFETQFEAAEIGDGKAFATGYFEPRIAGSRSKGPDYQVPVYAPPADLIEADLGQFSESLAGKRVRGRVDGGKFVPYHDRAAIEDGALAGKGLEIAWAADPVDLFFLEVQGSGQLALPGGGVMRIGYASQNGRDYVAIGKLLKDRGLVTGSVTMQSIAAWLRANPEQGRAVMRENKSYVFFTELTGEGPLGALGRPVTPRATVAADPKFVPLGAPVLLAVDRPEASGLWIAQDTGGAIRGANRFDTFWGPGAEAAIIAGGMSARGKAWLLLPKGILARIARSDGDSPAGR